VLFSIRAICADDEPFLWEMLYLAIHVPEGHPTPSRDILKAPDIAKYVQGWGRAGDTGLIAIDEAGEPIGAAWLRMFTKENPGYGYVADDIPELTMALLPQVRGKGVGTRLLRELLAANAVVSLSVDPDNAAIKLYQRLGFREVGVSGTSVTMLRDSRNLTKD